MYSNKFCFDVYNPDFKGKKVKDFITNDKKKSCTAFTLDLPKNQLEIKKTKINFKEYKEFCDIIIDTILAAFIMACYLKPKPDNTAFKTAVKVMK